MTFVPRSDGARWLVAVIGVVVGGGALFGGWGLLTDAEGLGAKRSWLEGSPFPNYIVPGVVLLVIVGGGMLTTALLAFLKHRFAGAAALAMGVITLAWGFVETTTIGYQGAGQIGLLVVFVVAPALV